MCVLESSGTVRSERVERCGIESERSIGIAYLSPIKPIRLHQPVHVCPNIEIVPPTRARRANRAPTLLVVVAAAVHAYSVALPRRPSSYSPCNLVLVMYPSLL